MKIKWDWQHTLILVASTFVAGVGNYLQSQPADAILSAFGSWTTAKPLVLGALYGGIAALVALAKSSFVQLTPPSGGAPSAPIAQPSAVPAAPPPPPVVTRRADKRVLGAAFAALACVFALSLGAIAGCSMLKAPSGPQAVATIEQDIAYVQSFETGAKDAWAVVDPLLGANAAKANTYFQNAIASLDQAIVVAQDAAAGYQAVTGDAGPDLAAAFVALQSAVAAVVDVIDVWRGQSDAGVGASPSDSLHHQAGVIAGWKAPAS